MSIRRIIGFFLTLASAGFAGWLIAWNSPVLGRIFATGGEGVLAIIGVALIIAVLGLAAFWPLRWNLAFNGRGNALRGVLVLIMAVAIFLLHGPIWDALQNANTWAAVGIVVGGLIWVAFLFVLTVLNPRPKFPSRVDGYAGGGEATAAATP